MVVKLQKVRIAFCQNLFKAGAIKPGDTPKFSSTFILHKDDPQVGTIKKAILAVAQEKWEEKYEAILKSLKAGAKICLHDGDTKAQYDGFEGNFFISSSSPTAPLVIDRDRSRLTEAAGKPYAGCYVNVNLEIWAQDNVWGKRVNATLKGVQFAADGDAFVGSAPASEEDFDDLSDTGDTTADDLIGDDVPFL